MLVDHLYTRYPIVARALGLVRARAKVSCIQVDCMQDTFARAAHSAKRGARRYGILYTNKSTTHFEGFVELSALLLHLERVGGNNMV